MLAETIETSLPLRGIASAPHVSSLSDAEVLKLTKLQMDKAQDKRLSFLLQSQQARKLSEDERVELRVLMQIYEDGLLRKAQGQVEGFLRGIYSPPET